MACLAPAYCVLVKSVALHSTETPHISVSFVLLALIHYYSQFCCNATAYATENCGIKIGSFNKNLVRPTLYLYDVYQMICGHMA
jgi:hypothetical protein